VFEIDLWHALLLVLVFFLCPGKFIRILKAIRAWAS